MGPAEAVKAHLDLGAPFTIAAHFQVFRLGIEGFDDAVTVLASTLKEHNLKPDTFIAPVFGQAIIMSPIVDEPVLLACEEHSSGSKLFNSCPSNMNFEEKAIPLQEG